MVDADAGVPLPALLALPEWAGRVRVLAGRLAPAALVTGLRPHAGLDLPDQVAGGELLALVGPVSLADWRLDALLRRVADTGGRGLLLAAAPAGGLGRTTGLLADRLGVVVLGADAPVLDLVVAARVFLAAPAVDHAGAVLAVHRALGGRLLAPPAVLAALDRVLGAPSALLDRHGTLIAGGAVELTGLRVAEPVPQRIAAPDRLLLAHPVLLPEERPVPAEQSSGQPTQPSPQAWLVVALAGAATSRADTAADALVVAAGAVRHWLLTRRLDLERDARARAALLGDVLRLTGEPSAELRRRAADAGWRLAGWHVGIRIGVSPGVDVVGLREDVRTALRAAGLAAVVAEDGAGWTAWVTVTDEPGPTEVRELAEQARAAHRGLARTLDVHTGIGRPRQGPEGIARTVAEAADAARLAAGRPETGRFLHVDRLGMAQLLLAWTRTDTFEPAARALLAPLRDQPGDLVRTLAVYLDAESSITETAAVLGVHRNTAAARIARVERLLDVSLADRDERLALQLACRTILLADRRETRDRPAR
ncbi:PucR C-terminal helix-turn-helix domain-containing protein [Goodfellowiella coeruleoviolacea]|uniref:PucR C-terminal helix-turn-helix domain-containing protein n=1 Tax=Goodfellowiella coeruleoviolacea TaxID=334858 RepID=A0AAE3GFG1_9PSEU|nr:PucR C-terminal helix-turn-helix domain-containing protein [Goodfellowiella coeruleoviolacea]